MPAPARVRSVSRLLVLAAVFAAWAFAAAAQSFSFGAQPVGATSGEQNVNVTAQIAGTVASVHILTLGVSGLDFEAGIGAMTCASATLSAGQTCIVSVTFTPAWPGSRAGAVELLDSQSRALGIAYISGSGVGGLDVLVTGNVLPVAGSGSATGPILDGNPATSASLDRPAGVALDGAGNLYIADTGHNRIRVVSASSGIISTLAGNGTAAYGGDGFVSNSTAVSLNAPGGVAVDGAGNVYIADTGNNVVRKITASTGIITTIAGTGATGSGGDGGAATAATLNQPQGVTVDSGGVLYIADTANHRIRAVDSLTGIIATIAGNGYINPSTGAGGYAGDGGASGSAELNFPYAVAFDPTGNLYIADAGNNAVRMVAASGGLISASGIITTVAGTGAAGGSGDGSWAALATLSSPSGVAADAAGNVYIADTANAAIRKVNGTSGIITTIASNGTGVYVSKSGNEQPISINAPIGLCLDGSANLYFADSQNNRIREIQSSFGVLDFTATPVAQGSQSLPQSFTVENDGNAPLAFTAITPDSNAALGAATSCGTGSSGLEAGGDCEIFAIFAPGQAGDPLIANILVDSAAPNSPLDIELLGDAAPVNPTITALTSSANPSGFGQPVVFTATITSGTGTAPIGGAVTLSDGVTPLGSPVAVNSAGQASFSAAALAVGVHSITASYSGDSTHAESNSAVLTQTVLEATSTTLASSINPATPGQSITFTAAVSASGGGGVAPAGIVTVTDGSATLSTVPLNANGTVTFTTAALVNGLHTIVATYNAAAALEVSGSVSSLVNQEVLVASQVAVVSAPNPSVYGGSVTFTATVTSSGSAVPTGRVSFLDSGTQIGIVNLAGTTGICAFTISTLAIGSHSITASYLGDTSNSPSNSAPTTQIVNPPATKTPTSTILVAVPVPAIAGVAVILTATVEPAHGAAAPTGTVTFTDTFAGTTVALGNPSLSAALTAVISPTLAAGTHSIVATYGGDAVNATGNSTPLVLVVQPAATSVALASSADPSVADSAVIFTTTVTGAGAAPSGVVAFLADGVPLGSAMLNHIGVATLSNSALTPGTHTITTSYAGDSNNAAGTSLPISQVVDTIPTSTALTASTTAGALSLTATVTGTTGPVSTGTVTFLIGTTTPGHCHAQR